MKNTFFVIGIMGFVALENPSSADSESLSQSDSFLTTAEQDAAAFIEPAPSLGESGYSHAIRPTGTPPKPKDFSLTESDLKVDLASEKPDEKIPLNNKEDAGDLPPPRTTCSDLLKSAGSPNASSEFIRDDALRSCVSLQALVSVIGRPGFTDPRFKVLVKSLRRKTKKKLWIFEAAKYAYQDPNAS